jgi:hypothetical protein
MRLRVEVKVDEPLLRAVTVYSSLLQTTESFVVQYERLPIYCFSDPAVCWDILPLPAPIRLIGMSKVSSLILQEGCRLMTMSGNLGTILQHLLTLERHNRVPMVVQTPIIRVQLLLVQGRLKIHLLQGVDVVLHVAGAGQAVDMGGVVPRRPVGRVSP